MNIDGVMENDIAPLMFVELRQFTPAQEFGLLFLQTSYDILNYQDDHLAKTSKVLQ